MVFISYIVVFNVSIILLITIAFSRVDSKLWAKSLKLYQLAELDNPNYDEYLQKEMDTEKEKKLNIFQFFAAAHNFDTWLYGFNGDRNTNLFVKSYWENCESDFRDPNYAINKYIINKFKIIIQNLRKCINKLKTGEDESTIIIDEDISLKTGEDESTIIIDEDISLKTGEDESTILIDVHKSLNEDISENQANQGCGKYELSSSQKMKKIKALDKVLYNDTNRRTFYRCFRKFKNNVFIITKQFEKATYPKNPIRLDIPTDKILTQKEKATILLDEDLTFLKENQIYKDDITQFEYLNMLKKYTGYSERDVTNNFSEECGNQMSYLTSIDWFFHYTEMIKHLIPISDDDDLKLIYSRRALFEESKYKFYVMRLVMSGYMPLAKPEWDEEKSATDNKNSVAIQELENRGV